jgi:hypothetical protein
MRRESAQLLLIHDVNISVLCADDVCMLSTTATSETTTRLGILHGCARICVMGLEHSMVAATSHPTCPHQRPNMRVSFCNIIAVTQLL